MELHRLLLDLVASGVPSDSHIHTIDCDNGHSIGYALVPDQQQAQRISVSCAQCQGLGRIVGPAKTGKTKPAATEPPPKPEAPPRQTVNRAASPEDLSRLSEEELTHRLATADRKSPLYKALRKVWSARNLAKARKVKEDRFLEDMKVVSDRISSGWDEYAADLPADGKSAISVILQKHPYQHKVEIDPVALFSACWIAERLWTGDFVSKLSNLWGFPSVSAFRGRIGSVWEWLDVEVRLKMPFMAKATGSPHKAEEALKKAAARKTEGQENPVDEDPVNVVRMNVA